MAGLLLAAGATAPARAAASPPGAVPGNWLQLTLTHGDARYGNSRGTLLLCDPPQGHPRAADACAELAAVDGDIRAIPPKKDAICSMVYAPVTAHATGRWNGRPVAYTQDFSNTCVMSAKTGAVFALDNEELTEPPAVPDN
ncbi:hypothetical protein ALMP_39330 [Streptomyces sp. A012304]|nr:hypothetical protein ALMP_39330 [Streptomyces sp. A012304]